MINFGSITATWPNHLVVKLNKPECDIDTIWEWARLNSTPMAVIMPDRSSDHVHNNTEILFRGLAKNMADNRVVCEINALDPLLM